MSEYAEKTVVTILGSGTCIPSLKRSSCAVMVKTGGSRLLLDCGPGTMHRLLAAETRIEEITHLFLSHFHPDHSGELVSFLFSTKYPEMLRTTPLTVIAGKGFSSFFKGLKAVFGHWIVLPPEMINIMEPDLENPAEYPFADFTLRVAPVVHNPESLAYRITAKNGKSIVYSGDTDFSEDLIRLAAGADLLICESALPDELKVPKHLTPSLAGEIAARAAVKKLVLTHFYPRCDTADIEFQCRKTWDGPLVLAEDLMEIVF